MFYIGLYRENLQKIFLPETTRPRALLFGKKHHLVHLFRVCSNNSTGAKNRPVPRGHIKLYMKTVLNTSIRFNNKNWLSQNKYMFGLTIAGTDQVSFGPVPVLM